MQKKSLLQPHKRTYKVPVTPRMILLQNFFEFDIDLVRRMKSNNIPMLFVDWLKKNLDESDTPAIVQKMSLKGSKTSYVATHGIARTYLE